MAVNNVITLLALYYLDDYGKDPFSEDYAEIYWGQKVVWREIPEQYTTAEECISWVQRTQLRSWDKSPFENRRIAYYTYLVRSRLLIIMLGDAMPQTKRPPL